MKRNSATTNLEVYFSYPLRSPEMVGQSRVGIKLCSAGNQAPSVSLLCVAFVFPKSSHCPACCWSFIYYVCIPASKKVEGERNTYIPFKDCPGICTHHFHLFPLARIEVKGHTLLQGRLRKAAFILSGHVVRELL